MLEGLLEYLVGIVFGFFLLAILILFFICTVYCHPVNRNNPTKNKNLNIKDEQEETLLWLDSICLNEPIHSAIQKKISHFIQTKISYFSLSPDCQSILKNVSVLSTKVPTISSSNVKSLVKDDRSLVTTININLDSPIIVTTSSFVNSLDKDVISDITITQINPTITLIIPYQKGAVNADIALGVDAEVDVNSAEPIGAGEDVLKGMFIKIMRNLDIKFDADDDEIFKENNTITNDNEFVEEEEEDDDFDDNDSCERYDTSSQTLNRGKIDLVIPQYPSISITAIHPSSDLFESNNQTKESEKVENETQTEKNSAPLSFSFSKRKDQINVKPDESILELIQKNKNKKDEDEKAKLKITKNRSSFFEVKLEKPNQKSFYSEEVFDFVPEEPKIEEEEQESDDDDDDEETITSSVKTAKRSFTIQ